MIKDELKRLGVETRMDRGFSVTLVDGEITLR
jgi:hypothetical protein